MKETIKAHHIERLQAGDCGIQGGIALVDLITSYERISSHCANVALHIVKKVSNIEGFDDMHGHITDRKSRNTEEYKALLHYYHAQYIDPIYATLPEAAVTEQTDDTEVANTNKKTDVSHHHPVKEHVEKRKEEISKKKEAIHSEKKNNEHKKSEKDNTVKKPEASDKNGKNHNTKKKEESSKKKSASNEVKKKHK